LPSPDGDDEGRATGTYKVSSLAIVTIRGMYIRLNLYNGEQNVDSISELVNGLFDKNDKTAYKCLKELLSTSEKNNDVYQFFNTFAEMIDSDNSYIRSRGLLLISANAKWDIDFKIDEIVDKYLRHIMDDKPITARQCIKTLPNIAKFKPELVDDILSALSKANPQRYAGSMQSLVYNDIRAALKTLNAL